MSTPFYVSPEQLMKDRADFARKGIARGRSVAAVQYADGVLFGTQQVGSSTGKLFVEDMTPRRIDEFLLGTARQINNRWTGRLYYRYREGSHFWEDTNNNARELYNPPPGIPRPPPNS